MIHPKVFLFLFLYGFPLAGFGASDAPKKETTFEQQFIDTNITISEWFDGLAEGLDYFLIGEKLTNTPNQTRVRIQNATFTEEGRSVKNFTSIGVFPRFHNLEKYWSLKFTTYDETEDERGIGNTYLRQTPRRQNYGATVGFFRNLGKIKTAFEPRIELQDPLKISHNLSFESLGKLGRYEVNPKLEFFAHATRGTGSFQALNINYTISRKMSLTFVNEGTYEDRTRIYTVYNGFSFGQVISRKSTLSYGLIFRSLNRPAYQMDGYSFSIGLNQLIYKRILDFQVVPHWDFYRDYDYKGRVGLNFTVNLNF